LHNYADSIQGDVSALNYNVIAALGTSLANAESAAKRDIRDRLAPELEDNELASLRSILDLQGPFLLSTEIGRSFLADAAAYDQTPDQEIAFREASIQFAEAIADEGIATERTEAFLVETAENIGLGIQPSRSAVAGTNTIRNVSAVLVLGALAFFPAVLSSTAPWIAAILMAEGIKKSAVGQDASNLVRDALDDPSQRKNLIKFAPFILKHETKLRTIAGDKGEFQFIHEWLDWMRANTKVD
jgi:hypothetical protein